MKIINKQKIYHSFIPHYQVLSNLYPKLLVSWNVKPVYAGIASKFSNRFQYKGSKLCGTKCFITISKLRITIFPSFYFVTFNFPFFHFLLINVKNTRNASSTTAVTVKWFFGRFRKTYRDTFFVLTWMFSICSHCNKRTVQTHCIIVNTVVLSIKMIFDVKNKLPVFL